MGNPNYEVCSLEELKDTLENIDKEMYPERVREIERHIQLRIEGVPPKTEQKLCPKCQAELFDSVDYSKWEMTAMVSFLLIPILDILALFLPAGEFRLECSRCGRKFKRSELNKSLNSDASDAGTG